MCDVTSLDFTRQSGTSLNARQAWSLNNAGALVSQLVAQLRSLGFRYDQPAACVLWLRSAFPRGTTSSLAGLTCISIKIDRPDDRAYEVGNPRIQDLRHLFCCTTVDFASHNNSIRRDRCTTWVYLVADGLRTRLILPSSKATLNSQSRKSSVRHELARPGPC